jgi:hypothetical protein
MTIQDMLLDLSNQVGALKRQLAQVESRDEAPQLLYLVDGVTAPSTTSLAQIYVDTADGDLKIKFADGTTKTIVTDT